MKKAKYLGLFGSIIFLISLGYAEEKFLQLEEIKITAPSVSEEFQRAPQEVKIIKEEELKNFGITLFSPLDLRERGGFDVQEDLSFRGTTFEQNFVLFEGIKITDLQTSHHLMNLPFSTENLSSVEILSGGASPLYGAGGFGGGLNFLLKPSKRELNFKVGYGSYDLKEWDFQAGLPFLKEKFFNFHFSQKKGPGFIWNRDFDIRNFNLYTKDSLTTLFYGFIEKDFGARNFYTPRYDGEWEETRTHLFLAKRLIPIGEILFEPAFLYRKNYDFYILDRRNPNFYQNKHKTSLYRIKLPFSFEKGKTLFGFGFEGSYENWDGVLRSGRLKKELLRREYSLFAFVKPVIKDRVYPSFQLRYDLHSHEKDFLSLGAGLSYLFSPKIKYRISLNHSYRLPSATELYYDSFGIKGNPTLSSEKALNFETGLDWLNKEKIFSITLFYRKGWNLIDWIYNGSTTVAENLNLKTIGFTLEHRQVYKEINFLLSYTYLNHFGEDIDFARYHGNYLRHNFITGIEVKLPYKTELLCLMNYQKRYGQEGVYLLNLEIKKELSKNFRLSFWGKNLLDESHYEIRYPEAEKGVLGIPQWFGLRLEGEF